MADTEHQWLIIASYEFTAEELRRHEGSAERIGLSYQHLLNVSGPACFKCEQFWQEAKDTPCPVADSERMPKDTGLKLTRSGRIEEYDRE